jgi:hypothetical protein
MLGHVKCAMLLVGAPVLALMVWPHGPLVSLIAVAAWGGGGYLLLTRGKRRPMHKALKKFAMNQDEARASTEWLARSPHALPGELSALCTRQQSVRHSQDRKFLTQKSHSTPRSGLLRNSD